MSKRGEIIRALISDGFISSEAARLDADSQITVTMCYLRKHGFPVETVWGIGYRLAPEHRERLASYPWAVRAMVAEDKSTSLIIRIPRSTVRVLGAMAEESGEPISVIASRCLEAGIDAECGA